VGEISKHHGISKDTIYKWMVMHGMPDHRVGRLQKFNKEHLNKWFKTDSVMTDEETD